MRTIITWTAILITLAGTVAAFADPPRTINYQGYLSSKGAPASGPLSMTFSLYSSDPARKNPVWQETQPAVPVSNGIYSVQLGDKNPLKVLFDVPYYLGVQIGSDPEMGLQPLSSAPYALRAISADDATSVSGQTLTSLDSRYLDPARPQPTSLQVATLRWDLVRSGVSTITTGTSPIALAFDGSSIWVANRVDGTVQKINPATASISPPITVGSFPYSLAFDGSSMWVANLRGNSVQKINPLTGAVGAPITVGIAPIALAFDGSYLWVVNNNNGGVGSVQKINPNTGAVGAAITVGLNPMSLAFDGSNLWVGNFGGSSVQKIHPATGVAGPAIAVSSSPRALAFDGSNIWVANYGGGTVQKINPANGLVGAPITVGMTPTGLAFDGSNLWVANQGSGTVMKINPATGAVSAPITVGTSPVALASDGSNIWVANSYSNTISRLSAATEAVGVQTVGTDQISGAIAADKLDMSTVVAKAGDTMSGALTLPVDGLSVGGTQIVTSGGKVGIGGQPANAAVLQVFNPTTSGQAALFQISNPANVLPAVYGSTVGNGQAVFGLNTGTGLAGHFQVWNPGSNSPALLATTDGTGAGIFGENTGSGNAGRFQIFNPDNGASALLAQTSGGGYAGEFIGPVKVTGMLTLPADGLTVGNNQLVTSAGKIGIGGLPVNPAKFQVFGANGGSTTLYGVNTGSGIAGHFQISNPTNKASALVAETNGTGFAGEFLGSVKVTGPLSSTVATGTAPFSVASTTQVNNLNAEMVGGKPASDFVLKSGATMSGQLVLPASGVKFADNSVQTIAKTDCMGRYDDNGDGTISDCRTGLIWLKDANCTATSGGITKNSPPPGSTTAGSLTWNDAITWTAGLGNNICGLSDGSSAGDWRMPTKTEWMAMVVNAKKQGFTFPALTNSAGTAQWVASDPFDNVQSDNYWSSSAFNYNSFNLIWFVNLSYGYVNTYVAHNATYYYVWPVRSGP